MGKPVDSFDWEDEDYGDIFDYPIGPPIVTEREGGEPFNFFKWLFNMGKTKPPRNIYVPKMRNPPPPPAKLVFVQCGGCGGSQHILKNNNWECSFCGNDSIPISESAAVNEVTKATVKTKKVILPPTAPEDRAEF